MSNIIAEHLREDQTIFVRGKLSYSRLTALIDGEDLARSIEQARARGSRYPTTKPHTTVSLVDATVNPVDPSNPTLEERYVMEKLYQVKNGDNAGKTGYSIDDKSPNLPPVFEKQDSGTYKQVKIEQDLDSGLDVTLVLGTYKQDGYDKRGIGINQVLVNEKIRYFQSAGTDTAALAAAGYVIEGPIERVAAKPATPQGTVVNDEGLALPGPVQQAPQQAAQPVQQAPAQQPAAQPTAQPVSEVDKDAEIAKLREQLAARQASGGPQGSSAFDQAASPWGDGGQPGIGFGN